jgi:hypothetical protein
MKAIIICDDFAFAANATSMLSRVVGNAGFHFKWTTQWWPLNTLNDLGLAQKSLAESMDAHLILFPDHVAQSLPSWAFDWLRRWAARRTVHDAALGVINYGTAGQFPELASFAREQDLSFIFGDDPPVRYPVKSFEPFQHERQISFPLAQTYLTGLAMWPSYRSFGMDRHFTGIARHRRVAGGASGCVDCKRCKCVKFQI